MLVWSGANVNLVQCHLPSATRLYRKRHEIFNAYSPWSFVSESFGKRIMVNFHLDQLKKTTTTKQELCQLNISLVAISNYLWTGMKTDLKWRVLGHTPLLIFALTLSEVEDSTRCKVVFKVLLFNSIQYITCWN